jgi:hypothetical protein
MTSILINSVLMGISEQRRQGVTAGSWKKEQMYGLHNICSSPNINMTSSW